MSIDAGGWPAIVGLFIMGLVYAVGATVYVTRVELNNNRAIDAAKELLLAVIEKEREKESKSRHDLSNHFMTQITSLDRDYRQLSDRFSSMVHKEDLVATENRLVAMFDKLDLRISTMIKASGYGREDRND